MGFTDRVLLNHLCVCVCVCVGRWVMGVHRPNPKSPRWPAEEVHKAPEHPDTHVTLREEREERKKRTGDGGRGDEGGEERGRGKYRISRCGRSCSKTNRHPAVVSHGVLCGVQCFSCLILPNEQLKKRKKKFFPSQKTYCFHDL